MYARDLDKILKNSQGVYLFDSHPGALSYIFKCYNEDKWYIIFLDILRIIDLSFNHLFAIADEELTNSGMLDATAKEVIAQGVAR